MWSDEVRRALEGGPSRADALRPEQLQALDAELARLLDPPAIEDGRAIQHVGSILGRATDEAGARAEWPLLSACWWSQGLLSWALFLRVEPPAHRHPLYLLFAAMLAYVRDARCAEDRRQLGEELLRRMRVYLDLRGRLEEGAGRQGPTPPDRFIWGNATAKGLTMLQYKLMDLLWGSGPRFRAVPLDEVVKRVYQGKRNKRPAHALMGLCSRTGDVLAEAGVRIEIVSRNGWLQLVPMPDPAQKPRARG